MTTTKAFTLMLFDNEASSLLHKMIGTSQNIIHSALACTACDLSAHRLLLFTNFVQCIGVGFESNRDLKTTSTSSFIRTAFKLLDRSIQRCQSSSPLFKRLALPECFVTTTRYLQVNRAHKFLHST